MSSSGNEDPWGVVYKVCRGRTARNESVGPIQHGGMPANGWNETMSVLMDRFFPGGPAVDSVVGAPLEVTQGLVEAAI